MKPTSGQWIFRLCTIAAVASLLFATFEGVGLVQAQPRVMTDVRDSTLQASNRVDAVELAAGVAESYAVPTGTNWIAFSSTLPDGTGPCTFLYNPNGTAAVPTTDVTNGSASVPNPSARIVTSGTSLSFWSAVDCVVILERHRTG
jgi:hypothetical protein